MRCVIEIDMENAAFFGNDELDLTELQRILTNLAKQFAGGNIDNYIDKQKLFDYNGNQVGECRIED